MTEFEQIVPAVTYNVKDKMTTINIDPVEDANGYEVYISDKSRGKYEFLTSGTYHILSHYIVETSAKYYKVRAYKQNDNDTISYTDFSKPQYVDLVIYAKNRDEKINNFFDSLHNISAILTNEDLDIAIDSLKLAGLEIKELEERRRLEENAEKIKREVDLKNQRKKLRAEREARKKLAIEEKHIQEVTSMELPTDYQNTYINEENNKHTDSTFDALMYSLDTLGMVDIEYIASLTGEDLKTVINNLKGSIYQNPLYWGEVFYKGWETSDEYLSGNLMHKYEVAKEANEKYHGYFENNITALEGIIEPEIATKDIYVTIGSPWLPTDIIDEFITYLAFKNDITSKEAKEYYLQCSSSEYATRHDEYTGIWEIPFKTRFRTSQFHGLFEQQNFHIYGTERMDMLYILESTLNMRTISISDVIDVQNKKRVINQEETIKALEKQKYMIETFQKWIWEDEERSQRIQAAYCRKYGNIRCRKFDGRYLELPGLNKEITLYPYQKNAIARILSSPNTLLAHKVGAGKTFTMICAGMELRRLGKSKKNMYVIPNNIITQWNSTFLKLYPNAKLLIVNNKNFSPKKRTDTLNKIKNEDYDAILITYSCFDMLSLSSKFYEDLYTKRKETLSKAAKKFASTAKIEKKIKTINEALEKIKKSYNETPLIMPFDELGINTLFVDEAHNYKNIDLDSRISSVKGVANSGSTKGNSMLDKVHCVQRMNNGGRIVFATGTPITNSISDIYVMQKYLQEGELYYQNILTFDAWVGMYAQKTTDFEIDVDSNNYHLVTRFSKYCNIPELSSTLSSITDFYQNNDNQEIPVLDGYSDSLSNGSQEFKDYLKEISNRADDIHKKRVSVKEDNMLKLTTDGRKAALDMRLIDTAFGLEPESKVFRCATNVFNLYEKNPNCTQLVFCDFSTPKDGFNLYDELKKLLIGFGIEEKRIAFIHNATSDDKKDEIFKKMNDSELSVLIGSTAKMGHGMNVQKHLLAIHHLDVPWRPSDMVQREGRILRQGNENSKVYIYRYITKASFDAYSWQLLETKQRFISQIMSGYTTFREGGEIDDAVLNYAEVKALAVDNPLIKKRVEVCNELEKYRILQKDYIEDKQKKEQIIRDLPLRIEEEKKRIDNCDLDIEAYQKEKVDYKNMPYLVQKDIRERIYQAVKANQNNSQAVEVLTYQGFKVVVPAYMIPRMTTNKDIDEDNGKSHLIPYIHLIKNNTYYLEIESEVGITTRLNNFLESLSKTKEKYMSVLEELKNRYETTKLELEKKNEGYSSKIELFESELEKVNRELGME